MNRFLKTCLLVELLSTNIYGVRQSTRSDEITTTITESQRLNTNCNKEDSTLEADVSDTSYAVTTASEVIYDNSSLLYDILNKSVSREIFQSSVGYTHHPSPHDGKYSMTTQTGDNRDQEHQEEITLRTMDKLLQMNGTRQYLRSIADESQQIILTEQLRYCPFTELCMFSFNLTPSNYKYTSPCRACSCGNSTVTSISSCPDVLNFTDFGKTTKPVSYECLPMYLKPPSITSYGTLYNTVTTCPSAASEQNYNCSSKGRHISSFGDILLPVTDRTNNMTYKNKYCAQCHSVRLQSLVPWSPILTCNGEEEHNYDSEEELIDFVIKTPSCNLQFSLENINSSEATTCSVIRSCNISGLWKTFDPFVSSACLFYENIYTYIAGERRQRRIIFRNVFCALCNGVIPSRLAIPGHTGKTESHSSAYSFSGLLKLEKRREEETRGSSVCENNFIYDVVKEICVELFCSTLRNLQNGVCEPAYTSIRGVIYIFTARVYPHNQMKNNYLQPSVFFNKFERKFSDAFFQDCFIRGDSCYRFIWLCYRNMYERFEQVNFNKSQALQYYEIELGFQIKKEWHSIEYILSRFSNMSFSNLSLTVRQTDFYYEVEARDFRYSLLERNNSQGFSRDYCSSIPDKIEVSRQKSCPLVELWLSDYDWFEDRAGINFPSLKITVDASLFHFGPNKSSIFVCADVYKGQFSVVLGEEFKEKFEFDVSTTLSLVCVCISLLCLTVSLVTFCLFPRLRSLPGKTNMALIVCLLLAQTFFLIGSFSRLPRESFPCMALGLVTHFFWLMVIFWMNVCTFHVFKVFSGTDIILSGKGSKALRVYWLYSVSLSLLLVLINCFVSLHASSFEDIGYGKTSCYINSEKMVVFTFGIPAGFVIITNMLMFISSVCKVLKMPEIQKDVKHERNDLIIFGKLSTLTGCTWIFGFVYSWTEIEVFSYLFIILNASQGVFLFLSFVCNKRVLSMYKNKLLRVPVSTSSYRTRTTDTNATITRPAGK